MTRKLAIDALIDSAPDAGKVLAFLKGNKFPLVEGTRATFVWLGAADGVTLRH